MKQPTHQADIDRTTAHVGDCYVWAEIYYLDSPTDYREYISNRQPQPPAPRSELVMLDEAIPLPAAAKISLVLLVAGVLLLTMR